jgi:uncharacterized protein DUF4349
MKEPESTVADTRLVEADLALIEAALAGGEPRSREPRERELEELALLLRDDVASPRSEFAAELGQRVEAGFPRERRLLGWIEPRARAAAAGARRLDPRRAGVRRKSLPILAGASALLVGLVVAVSLSNEGRNQPASSAGAGHGAAGTEKPTILPATGPDGSATYDRADPLLAPRAESARGGRLLPGIRNRRIERSAQLTLAAPDNRLDHVADQIIAITDRHGGFVLHSSVNTGREGAPGGSFDLRIPAGELRQALRELSSIATVRARSQSGQDITKGFVSVQDRLGTLGAQRRGLLRRLENAQSNEQADALRRQIELVSRDINGLRARLRGLRERVAYAAVSVTLEQKDGHAGAAAHGGTRDAFDDSLGSLVATLNFLIRALGVLLPLGLASALAWLGAGAVRRRRREAALS